MKLSLMPTWTCSFPTRVHWCPVDDPEDLGDGLKALWMIENPLIGWRKIYDPFCGHLPFDRVLEPLEMVLGHEEDLVPTYIVVRWHLDTCLHVMGWCGVDDVVDTLACSWRWPWYPWWGHGVLGGGHMTILHMVFCPWFLDEALVAWCNLWWLWSFDIERGHNVLKPTNLGGSMLLHLTCSWNP